MYNISVIKYLRWYYEAMMENYLAHSRKIITAVDEFDFMERIKPSAIMEYFQDLATVHAAEIGISCETMKERNLCWVLNRLSAVIERSPMLGEEITVTTFPHKPGIADALRDYYIFDGKGELLIRGTSRWCVLDIESKRVRRCAPLFDFDDSAYNPEFAVPDGNPQLADIDSLPDCSKSVSSGIVNITDLDRNGHMNNARYADIVVNSCGFDFYAAHTIKAFDFNFLSEMKAGNEYEVVVKNFDDTSYFEARGGNERKTVFRAAIDWK